MADTQSSSSAEVEGYIEPSVSTHTIQFAQVQDPGQVQITGNEKSSRWSNQDDIHLCDALIDQKKLGRSRDKAVFSLEAWNQVAEVMKGSELVSGGAQKTVPQCKARWQRLKIEFRIVKHLRQQPGFQWDESTHMVTALAATWEAYIAEHRDAQPWRKKSFPTYSRVAHIIEDENGHDPGEANFKRRWKAAAQSAQNTEGNEPSSSSNGGPLSSTSVFSVNGSPNPIVPSITFAAQAVPEVTMTMPLNGGAGAIHQYRLPTVETNGKRVESPVSDHQANSKRPRSETSSATAVSSPPQGTYNYYAGSPVPSHIPTYGTGPIPYVVPSGPAPTPSPATSRLATAIKILEESEGLPDADFVKAVQLFQRRAEAADAYLAIQSKRARSLYLRAELDDSASS